MKAKYFWVLGVVILIIAIAALALSFLGRRPTITSGDVVEKLRTASYLTTTEYTIQVVAKNERPGHWYAVGQDYKRSLLVAKGTVRAGIDLSQLDASAVSVSEDAKSITVNLPPAIILNRDQCLSSDPQDTYVSSPSEGLLQFVADTKDQQTQLYSDAAEGLVKAACEGGILERATTDAKFAIEQLLIAIVPNVNVTVVGGPVTECIAE